jgi:cytochrome c oxidase subunit 4
MTMNAHAHDSHHDDGKVHAHVAPALFYWGIFSALIFLTVVTVGASYIDFGAANTVIAVLIATVKAALVATFFMHLQHDKAFNSVILVMSFVFLGVFIFLTNEDVSTRNKLDEANGSHRYVKSGEIAPAHFDGQKLVVAPHAEGHGEGHEKPAEGAHH